MFLGQYRLSLGDDQSMVIPGAFQEPLAHGAYITRGFEQNLLIMTEKQFRTTSERVAALNMADPSVRLLNRLILAHAAPLDIDANGRGLIPDKLGAFAGFDKEIILVGQG